MTSAYLFDSHALLAFFQKEDGAELVARILNEAIRQNLDRLICVINFGEIIYLTKKRFGEEKKIEILGRIHQMGMRVLPYLRACSLPTRGFLSSGLVSRTINGKSLASRSRKSIKPLAVF